MSDRPGSQGKPPDPDSHPIHYLRGPGRGGRLERVGGWGREVGEGRGLGMWWGEVGRGRELGMWWGDGGGGGYGDEGMDFRMCLGVGVEAWV